MLFAKTLLHDHDDVQVQAQLGAGVDVTRDEIASGSAIGPRHRNYFLFQVSGYLEHDALLRLANYSKWQP